MVHNELSADPDEIMEWVCPYCPQTRQSLGEIREHITESSEGQHRGIDGLKPTRDIVAYGPEGEVDRVEGVSTEPADPLEQYDKREIIINAWLAADRDPDREAVQEISGASQQYVSRLLNELEAGEMPRETYREVLDYGLKDELEVRFEEKESEMEESKSMTESRTSEQILEQVSKKQQIIIAHEVASENATKKEIAEALDSSYEYVREIFHDIEDRDPEEWKKLREGDLEKEPSNNVKDAVRERLRRGGVETTQGHVDEMRERAETTPRSPVNGTVQASDIEDVLEKVELLREQAEYTEQGDAEFIAKKSIEWLNDLLEDAD